MKYSASMPGIFRDLHVVIVLWFPFLGRLDKYVPSHLPVVCVKFADYEFSLGSCICAGNPETHTAVPQQSSKELILHFIFIIFKISHTSNWNLTSEAYGYLE